MANTTFTGPVRSQNGFQNISIDSTTGAVTVTSIYGNAEVLGTQALSGAGAVDGGSAVLTPTTKIGFSTITFTNVGESASLVYTSAGWAITALNGAVAA